MYARLRGPKSLLTLYQIKIKPDFPFLAEEIAKPRPGMNIKVAAFTVSEKSINTVKKLNILASLCSWSNWIEHSMVANLKGRVRWSIGRSIQLSMKFQSLIKTKMLQIKRVLPV